MHKVILSYETKTICIQLIETHRGYRLSTEKNIYYIDQKLALDRFSEEVSNVAQI